MKRWLGEIPLADGPARILADMGAKATALLLIAWVAALCLRKSSAAARHRAWLLALCGLIALPVLSRFAPEWRLPVLPAPTQVQDQAREVAIPPAIARAVPAVPIPSDIPLISRSEIASTSPPPSAAPPARSNAVGAEAAHADVASPPVPRIQPRRWTPSEWLIAVWAFGFLATTSPLLLGVLVNEWTRRRAVPAASEEWTSLLDALRRQLSIRRPVDLRLGKSLQIPMTWGLIRPVIWLPENAREWPEPTLRVVLLHELAHIARLDAGSQMIGRLAAALSWFHPLAWYALHRLRTECEYACDDLVLEAGERPTNYASQLVKLARALRTPRFPMAVAMARPNALEGRIMQMLDDSRSRRPLGRNTGRVLTIGAGALILIIATARPGPSAVAPDEPKALATTTPAEPNTAAPKATGRITGRVIRAEGGQAAPRAEVILLPPPPKGQDAYYGKLPLRRIVADEAGAFSFDGLEAGRYRVWANLEGLTSRSRSTRGETVILPEAGMAPGPVELRLARAVEVTVQVKEKATGKPIAGATIHPTWSDFLDDFTTGPDGRAFIRPLTAERWHLEVWAPSFAKQTRWLNLESGADATAEFALEPGGDLEGTVRDPAGKPLEKIGLSIRPEGEGEEFEYVETDADGRYQLAHLPLDTLLSLTAYHDDFLHRNVNVRVTAPKQMLDVAMQSRPDGGSVAGVVLDGQGQPIAKAEVVNMGRSTSETRETKTGPDGRFRLDNLYDGTTGKELIVRAGGFAPKRVKVEPTPDGKPTEVKIELEPGHRIKGRVVDDQGRPLQGVGVYYAHGNWGFSDGGRAETDDQGRFSFDTLPPETPFAFIKEGFSEIDGRQLPLDGEAEVTVEMTPAGVIAGRVLDAATGKPIPTFNVSVTFSPKRQPDEPSAGLRSDISDPGQVYQSDTGDFKLGDLVAGMPLQVMISANGYERAVSERVVAARPDKAQVTEFRLAQIDPTKLRTYRGRLLGANGQPAARVQLRLIATANRGVTGRQGYPFNWEMIRSGQLAQHANALRFVSSVTDAEGHFEFANVPRDAEVELAWWGEGIAPGREDHLERSGEEEPIVIKLPAPASIAASFDRESFPDASRIALYGSNYGSAERSLEPGQSESKFEGLAPGKYTVALTGPYERVPGTDGAIQAKALASKTVTVEAGEEVRVDLRK